MLYVGDLDHDALALALVYLEDIATLCWFDVFGGLFYDALAIGLLHLEEFNVGGPLIWLMHLEALEVIA